MSRLFSLIGVTFKKIFGVGESFCCPCCGTRVYFCSPARSELIKHMIVSRFVQNLNNMYKLPLSFEKSLHELMEDLPETKDGRTLYSQCVEDEK
jgi:hypothetical protein